MNIDHNLFNTSKAYQTLEPTVNSKNDAVNITVDSENIYSTYRKAVECSSVSTDNQVETENNAQNFLPEISSQQLLVICSPSTQQLFPSKQFSTESVPSINSE